jgi:hypothetical protein
LDATFLPASSSLVSRALAFKLDHPVASDSAANFGFQKFRISHVSYKPHSLATTIKKNDQQHSSQIDSRGYYISNKVLVDRLSSQNIIIPKGKY